MGGSATYEVVITGVTQAVFTVRDNLVRAGVREEKAEQILNTLPCTVKSGLALEQAQQYQQVFEAAGARVELRPLVSHAASPSGAAPPPVRVALERDIAARRQQREPPPAKAFVDSFPDVFRYLKLRPVLLTAAGTAVAVYVLRLVGWRGGTLAFGIEAAVYFHILQATAYGETDDLRLPDLSDVGSELFAPLFRYLASELIILVALSWMTFEAVQRYLGGAADINLWSGPPGPVLLLVAGLLLWPLLTCIAAISRSVVAMYNPVVWVSTLRELGRDYLTAVGAFYALLVVELVVLGGLAYRFAAAAPIPIVTPLLISFARIMCIIARARLLGALCAPRLHR